MFAVFGGLDIDIDPSRQIDALIIEHILEHYTLLSGYIDSLISADKDVKKLLAALSVGDRRIFSSFKKARLNNIQGGIALNFLSRSGLIKIEYSREEDKRSWKPKLSKEEAKHRISDKFLIVYPFIRFWFYFIYPHAKEIQNGNFKRVLEEFKEKKYGYTSLVFEELSRVMLHFHLRDEEVHTLDSYWDAKVELDIMVKTKKNSFYVAECKWTNHKVNKKELNKLKEKCEIMGIVPKQMLFFSKRGFSRELLAMQGKDLVLFDVEDFRALLHVKPTKRSFPLEPYAALIQSSL